MNKTEAGRARAKAEADIALSLPAEYRDSRTRKMTRERNISCTQPIRQPNAGGATDAHTPTPPAACDRNALSALSNLGSKNLTRLDFNRRVCVCDFATASFKILSRLVL